MPECARSDIENCTQEQLVNTYDNTALLYVSYHGESLGDSGLYLHGTPCKVAPDQQTHIPMQVWMPRRINFNKRRATEDWVALAFD